MQDKLRVFVSSSSDLFEVRKAIDKKLRNWFDQTGLSDEVEPYLWEEDTENGLLLSARQPVQEQIPDPLEWSIPFTICMFGERIGVPLADKLRPEWEDRLSSWWATNDDPGLQHPWPDDTKTQTTYLKRGDFPLTGTVFELISACEVPEDYRNLILGYSATRSVDVASNIHDIFFNDEKEKKRIRKKGQTPAEQNAWEKAEYEPQVQALFNFLTYLREQKLIDVTCYPNEKDMTQKLLRRADHDLRKHFNVESENNPFKLSLTHFGVDDTNELPGRRDQINSALRHLQDPRDRPLVLITGPSGCGKSSLLQRGILGKLQDDGIQVLAIRPTELEIQPGKDRLDIFWELICERIDGCHIGRLPKFRRDKKMAERTIEVLESRNLKLAVGLDQFEEMIDEMRLFSEKEHRQKGWWLLMRFLREISKCERVSIFATLESSREKSFEELGIENLTNMRWVTVEADVGPSEIAKIAVDGFKRGGFDLDGALVQEIKNKWKLFVEDLGTATGNASLLPLAALWMAQLYQRFEDLASVPVTNGSALVDALSDAIHEKPKLTLEDIGGKDEIDFKGVIGRLADDAWRDALGNSPPSGPIESDHESYSELINFLDLLIALDDTGRIRLLSGPTGGPGKYSERIYDTFIEQRLLVPAGRANRVRLVHQAIIDHWEPAKKWFKWREDYLKLEQEMRKKALGWYDSGQDDVAGDFKTAQMAAQVMIANVDEWTMSERTSLSKTAEILRSYCIKHLELAPDLSPVVKSSPSSNTMAHCAAAYHLTKPLSHFIKTDPSNLLIENSTGRSLMQSAAFTDGPAVALLLEYAKRYGELEWPTKPDKRGFHPIAMSIQEHANQNFGALVSLYENPNVPVRPNAQTMLHIAAMTDNVEAADVLLERSGLDLRLRTSNGWQAIDTAAYWGRDGVFELLLPHIDPPTESHLHPLHRAAFKGKADIIRRFMESDSVNEEVREAALIHKPEGFSRTPLMEAAFNRQPDALAELLRYCNMADPTHVDPHGRTLFHLVMKKVGFEEPTADEQSRARHCIELLLAETDFDVSTLDLDLISAVDRKAFNAAWRILRKHLPFDYASMDEGLKKEDLLSTNPREHRRILTGAPQVLRDKFGDKNGLDLLIDAKRTTTLAFVLKMKDAPMGLIRLRWTELVRLAAGADKILLRRAVIETLPKSSKVNLSVLLDRCLRNKTSQDEGLLENLFARGVKLNSGAGELGMTVFHDLARKGDPERFETLAKGREFKLPRDDWGRVPSDLAAPEHAQTIARLEAKHFQGKALKRANAVDAAPYFVLENQEGTKPLPQLRRKVIRRLRKVPELQGFEVRKLKTLAYKAPFYRATSVIVATHPDWDAGHLQMCFLQRGPDIFPLLGKSPPIHEFNATFKTRITEKHALAYLAFFCFFVRGEEGPFLILDRPENKFVPTSLAQSQTIKVCPQVRLWGKDERGFIRASATVFYSNALFATDFLIQPTGMIKMVDDMLLVADLDEKVASQIDPSKE